MEMALNGVGFDVGRAAGARRPGSSPHWKRRPFPDRRDQQRRDRRRVEIPVAQAAEAAESSPAERLVSAVRGGVRHAVNNGILR